MGCRQISIQEAVHHIAGLDLCISSDSIHYAGLGQIVFLSRKNQGRPPPKELKADLIKGYTWRSPQLADMSLHEYFYEKFRVSEFEKDKDTGRQKNRILLPKGLNCRPRYPVDYEYARGIICLHKPWSNSEPIKTLLDDKEKTISTFLSMMGKLEFPFEVVAEYHRAIMYSQEYRHQCLNKRATSKEDVDLDTLDDDEKEAHLHWHHSRNLSAQNSRYFNNMLANEQVNIGLDHDWSKTTFKGQRADDLMPPELYTKALRDSFYGSDGTEMSTSGLIIPRKKDDSRYELDDLNHQQRAVVLSAMEAIIKFLTNDETYVPLRATVVGCGGTGKSFIINTLVTLVRELTKTNDAVKIAAPSGGAAYNVGGCTLHRCFGLPIHSDALSKNLSEQRQTELAEKLKHMLALIIDERSMISSMVMGATERNTRHCVFGRQNVLEKWGGIPVVLIFGDDYQLPPVIHEGAIEGFAKRSEIQDPKQEKKSSDHQLLVDWGHDIFIDDLTQKVFHLTENYRSKDDPEFRDLLDNVRPGYPTIEDADRLMLQSMHHHQQNTAFKELIDNDPKTIYLFTTNKEVNHKNLMKLIALSKTSARPVAKLGCQWRSTRTLATGPNSVFRSHFAKQTNLVIHTDLCVGATVAISGQNIVPEVGLYNGARGTIVDFIYDTVCGPNDKQNDHLPKAIIVDFPGFKHKNVKPWDSNHPTVSTQIYNEISFTNGTITIPHAGIFV